MLDTVGHAIIGHVGHVVNEHVVGHVGCGCVAVLIWLPVGYSGWKFMHMQYLFASHLGPCML